MNYDIKTLLEIATNLAQGIDPVTGKVFQEDTVLNSPLIKNFNSDVAAILDEINQRSSKKKLRSREFILFTEDEIEDYIISEEPITISKICKKLDEVRRSSAKMLRASEISEWLYALGYLTAVNQDTSSRFPTKKGSDLGITYEERRTKDGNIYRVNVYNETAEKYVVENINFAIKFLKDQYY